MPNSVVFKVMNVIEDFFIDFINKACKICEFVYITPKYLVIEFSWLPASSSSSFKHQILTPPGYYS